MDHDGHTLRRLAPAAALGAGLALAGIGAAIGLLLGIELCACERCRVARHARAVGRPGRPPAGGA